MLGGGGSSSSSRKSDFLASAKAARDLRQAEKVKESAAILLQSTTRGWLARVKIRRDVVREFDEQFPVIDDDAATASKPPVTTKPAVASYKVARNFLSFAKVSDESERFERFCRYVLASLDSDSPKMSYISVALNKDTAIPWISHVKTVLAICSGKLENFKFDSGCAGELNTMLRMLIGFTSPNTWAILRVKSMEKLLPGMNQLCANFMGHLVQLGFLRHLNGLLLRGLCSSRIQLKKTSLAAVVTLAMRPVVAANFSDKLLSLFLLNVLSVPALVAHLEAMSPESLNLLEKHEMLSRSVRVLANDQELKIHFNALEGSYSLCLTANLAHLLSLRSSAGSTEELDLLGVVSVLTGLLDSCGQYVTAKQSNLSHWHPVLGWFSVSLDSYLQVSMERVKLQLAKLWSPSCLRLLLRCLLETVERLPELSPPPPRESSPVEGNAARQLFKRALEKTRTSVGPQPPKGGYTKLGSNECRRIAMTCTLYQNALKTLSQLRLEILAGLCYQNIILVPLWRLIQSLGPQCGLKAFLDHLSAHSKGTAPEFQILILFSDCLTYVVTILDDIEMYEKQTPFTLDQYAQMSLFLNSFLYKSVTSGLLIDPKAPLFSSLHALLMLLYGRDNKRPFVGTTHWLIRDIRLSSFMSDLDKGKKSTLLLIQKMPHVIPHDDRVVLFRRKVTAEKGTLGLLAEADVSSSFSTLVTIHRSRIVEDGYRQLSTLSALALKGVIRVKFVNVQGLDEAGIDQDGVFKEFLEETVKKVFDPGLNLFCATSEERLYPSPMSHLTDNHLHLFEFVGKMIGKAVYEGIVIDVPFAPFFLSQVLGKDHSAFYSYIDELPSLDPELYRNLAYMKRYEGDVADLDLTFSFDQDMMGQIVTHELIPGGRGVAVTNENKISYMHHVAYFRMHTQVKEQTAAFTRGFRSIIPNDWLLLFSPLEVQRLISGDNSPLDLKDLRRHTHYYGGFHDSHRVVNWLWEVLEKDFDDKERSAFLKFVTSCSKPPLLGFEHLEPPFSIRCVEVGDDDDDGDTVGSVLRGFLALRRKDPVNRLPTASTCFNLLKLPNYQKKATLREKLRYAISCNTGFELS